MFDRPVITAEATPVGLDDQLSQLQAMLALAGEYANMEYTIAAPQHENGAAAPSSLAARYATANSITRRRFDTILREAETMATVGVRLITRRCGRTDAATIAAARFLGTTIDAAIRRLENMLSPRPI